MKKHSKKNELNGLSTMQIRTRSFFLANFRRPNGTIDTKQAAEFFHVSPRTINNWVVTGCPTWVDNYVVMYERSIPDDKEWDGFKFVNGRLFTPYDRLTFSPGELLNIHYARQFNRLDRIERDKLKGVVHELRNDDEARAIREEIDFMIDTLKKIKGSPIVAPEFGVHQKVSKKR